MHLWCFVLACKKPGYWTRRAVLIIASEAEGYADPHTKTHRHKKKQVLLVVVLWFHPVGCLSQMRDTTNCPVAFFLHFARSIAFFFALCPSHRFFFTLCRSHRFFFALCLSHCNFFALCPFHRFFLHFAGHIAFFFFCTLSVTSHFFCNLVVASFFFCNPLSQLHFFCNGKIGHESSSENRQSQTPPPEFGKAQSWESEWLPTMGSHAGFLKMQPGTSPSTLAQKKKQWKPMCFSRCIFFCNLKLKV